MSDANNYTAVKHFTHLSECKWIKPSEARSGLVYTGPIGQVYICHVIAGDASFLELGEQQALKNYWEMPSKIHPFAPGEKITLTGV